MSTINPLDVIAQRGTAKAARVGSRPVLAALLAADFGLAASGFLGVAGLSSLFAIARIEETNTFPLVALMPLLLPVGIFGSIGFLIAQAVARRAYTGGQSFVRALADGQPIWFAGSAVAAWMCLAWLAVENIRGEQRYWPPPETSPESAGYWALAVLPWILPTLLTLGLFLSIWRRIARGKRQQRAASTFESAFATGTRAAGVVTQGVERPRESPRVVSRWTVQFTDHHGQTRWTTPLGLFHEDSLPQVGDAVTVIFDPQNPSDESRILVAREHPERIESYRAHKPPFPFGG